MSKLLECFYSATAQNVQTMLIGRLLAGIGIGISSAIVPLYISEVLYFWGFRSFCYFKSEVDAGNSNIC